MMKKVRIYIIFSDYIVLSHYNLYESMPVCNQTLKKCPNGTAWEIITRQLCLYMYAQTENTSQWWIAIAVLLHPGFQSHPLF